MADVRVASSLKPPEPPPEAGQPGAVVWARHNLFNTPFNTVLTLVLGAGLIATVAGVLRFLLADVRKWGVIPRNATNYLVEAYPREDLERAWISLLIVAVLTGLSLAAWKPTGKTSWLSVVAGVRAIAVVSLVVGIFAPSTYGGRMPAAITGIALLVVSIGAASLLGERASEERIPTLWILVGVAVLALAFVWALPIESSTKVPLTLVTAAAVLAHLGGRPLAHRIGSAALRAYMVGAWVLSLPIIYLHIQRKPVVDWDVFVSDWLAWIAVVFAIGVGGIVFASRAGRERAAVLNAVLVVASIASWVVSFPFVGRTLLVLATALSLATPTFAAGARGRRTMLGAWVGITVFVTYLFLVGAAETGLDTRNEYFGGLNLTFMLAIAAILLSFPLGIALALGRTSTMPIFRLLSTGYIETIRGVPLITVLFFAVYVIPNFLPRGIDLDANVVVLAGMTMFSAAYLAENVRGGLQSIPKGQYEAAKAMGMTTAQMTMLITLPQALRAVIPAIVGQVISLFKDTSLVAIVGLADFFRVARNIVPAQTESLGSVLENLMFAAVVYWVFTFSFSRASQRLERKLGVGSR